MYKLLDRNYPKDRNQTADLLKGFAVLMMIQVHLMELFAKQHIHDALIGKISFFLGGPPAAPLFMAVMGFFLSKSKKSFSQNIKRGFLLIVGGILLNLGLNFYLLVLIFSEKIQLNAFHYILGADILPLAGLSVILIAFIKKITHNSFLSSIILSLFLLIFILILHAASVDHTINDNVLVYVQAFFWGNLEWSYFPFLPWAVYPLIGFLYHRVSTKFKVRKPIEAFVASISAVVTIVSIKYGVEINLEPSTYYHHSPLYTLWIIQFLVLLVLGAERLELLWGKSLLLLFLKWLGKNVTAAYVFQWLIIGNISTAIYQTQSELELVVWFILVTALTSILIFIYDKQFGKREQNIQS